MKPAYFPYIAIALGVVLLLAVIKGSQLSSQGETHLPLLTLLLMSEFSAIVTAIAAFLGFKQIRSGSYTPVYLLTTIACGLLSACFLYLGIKLWPG